MQTRGEGTACVSATQAVDDGEPDDDHRVDGRPAPDQFRHLREEDQDRQRIDEPCDHRTRDEAHQVAEPQQSGADLDETRHDRGGEKVLQPMLAHETRHHEGGGTGGGRDHRWASAEDGRRDRDAERGVQPDLRVDTRDQRKGDRLRDQRQRDDGAGQQFARDVRGPLSPQCREGHRNDPARAENGLRASRRTGWEREKPPVLAGQPVARGGRVVARAAMAGSPTMGKRLSEPSLPVDGGAHAGNPISAHPAIRAASRRSATSCAIRSGLASQANMKRAPPPMKV